MRLTVLTPYVPYPGIPHAGGDFLDRYLRRARRDAEVRILAPATDDNVAALDPARDAGHDVRLVPIDGRRRPLPGRVQDRARTLLGGLGLEAQLERSLRRAMPWSEMAASDVVEVQWSLFLPFVADLRRAASDLAISVMLHDVVSEQLARRARSADVRRERWYARVMVARARRREPRLLNAADVGWVFSDKDRTLLADLGVRVPVHVLDPPLHSPSAPPGPAAAPTVLFTGYMRRSPNFEGALWFLDRVWPAVVGRVPDARLVLAGSDPPPALRARAGATVEVTGFVDDLDPCYRAARVFVAPLRSGAGLKFKVPQAMLYGLPVVATLVAAEGVVERSGSEAFGAVTDDPAAMADAVVELLENPRRARNVGARARAWAQEAHDFDAGVERVLATYRDLSRRGAAR